MRRLIRTGTAAGAQAAVACGPVAHRAWATYLSAGTMVTRQRDERRMTGERGNLLAAYRRTADAVVAELSEHPKVIGVAVCGSLVSGDVWEESDIDIFALLRDPEADWHCMAVRHGNVIVHLQLLSEEFLLRRSDRFRGGIISQVLCRCHVVHDPEGVFTGGIASLSSYPESAQIHHAVEHLIGFLSEFQQARKYLEMGFAEDAYLHTNLAFRELAYVEYARYGRYPQRSFMEELVDVSPNTYRAYVWFIHGGKKASDRIRRSFAMFERVLDEVFGDLGPTLIAAIRKAELPVTNEVIGDLPSIYNQSDNLRLLIEEMVDRHLIREDKRALAIEGVPLTTLSETLFDLF